MTLPQIGEIWQYELDDITLEYHVILSNGKEFNFRTSQTVTSYETFDLLTETFETIYIGRSTSEYWTRLA